MLPAVLYTAKCFWPGITEKKLRLSADHAASGESAAHARFRGALYLPSDELVLCLFDAGTREQVKQASEQAGLPCERIIETVWLPPGRRETEQKWPA
jgi:uncharacterized protein DUF4242